MRLYLDNCALARLMDDLTQDRVRAEESAVRQILQDCDAGLHRWVASDMLLFEIRQNPNASVRERALLVVAKAHEIQTVTQDILHRSVATVGRGVGLADAIHLHAALAARCEALITTDVRFLRQAARLPEIAPGFVRNPLDV